MNKLRCIFVDWQVELQLNLKIKITCKILFFFIVKKKCFFSKRETNLRAIADEILLNFVCCPSQSQGMWCCLRKSHQNHAIELAAWFCRTSMARWAQAMKNRSQWLGYRIEHSGWFASHCTNHHLCYAMKIQHELSQDLNHCTKCWCNVQLLRCILTKLCCHRKSVIRIAEDWLAMEPGWCSWPHHQQFVHPTAVLAGVLCNEFKVQRLLFVHFWFYFGKF